MFNWLCSKTTDVISTTQGGTVSREKELESQVLELKKQKEAEDHERKSSEYRGMETSYTMSVYFVDGSFKSIFRSFKGTASDHMSLSFGSVYHSYSYVKPSIRAEKDIKLTKDKLHTQGITDGGTVYLAHTISKVEFGDIDNSKENTNDKP